MNMIKVMFVCLGNICRSPMAEFVLKELVRRKGLETDFYIVDLGRGTIKIGNIGDIYYDYDVSGAEWAFVTRKNQYASADSVVVYR